MTEAMKALRHHPMIEAWIREAERPRPADCGICGFPHAAHLVCMTAPFGVVMFGGSAYSVRLNNAAWWIEFMGKYAPSGAFHWRDEKFFRRTPDGVEITFFTPYNDTPQRSVWTIPQHEWDSIVSGVKRPTADTVALPLADLTEVLEFLEEHEDVNTHGDGPNRAMSLATRMRALLPAA